MNQTTENILGTGVVQLTSGHRAPSEAEVGGLIVHPAARGFGIASLMKVMIFYAIKMDLEAITRQVRLSRSSPARRHHG